jgi:hypothetical protein
MGGSQEQPATVVKPRSTKVAARALVGRTNKLRGLRHRILGAR